MWLLHREAILGLGFSRASSFSSWRIHGWPKQVADHSPFQSQPLARLLGTITAAELLVFGSREQAAATAAQLRRLHAPVHGTLQETVGSRHAGAMYSAEDPEALLWVLITLLDTSIRVYEAGLGTLADETVRSYLAEGARLGEMLGVPGSTVPADRAALDHYMGQMIADGAVAVGPPARRVARALLDAQVVPGLAWRIYRRLTRAVAAATLPNPLREQYGSLLPPRHRLLSGIGGHLGRLVLPHLPDRLRLDPLAATAIRRPNYGAPDLGSHPCSEVDNAGLSGHTRPEGWGAQGNHPPPEQAYPKRIELLRGTWAYRQARSWRSREGCEHGVLLGKAPSTTPS